MALNLDTRQRAMLQDMGITLWWPQTAAPALAPATLPPAAMAEAIAPPIPAVATVATAAAAIPSAPVPVPAAAVAAPVAAAPTAPVTPTVPAAPAASWRIAPAVQAFPQATQGRADDAWLVIWESPHPSTPLEGDTGKLLHNMLRALRLHHSPHVWIAGVQRPGLDALPMAGITTEPVPWQDLAPGLHTHIQRTQPARIVVLGLHAARAVLGSEEALGRLRAQVHQLHNTPALVSYDPAYLLRSPHAKHAAWADLCRAHALRPPSAP